MNDCNAPFFARQPLLAHLQQCSKLSRGWYYCPNCQRFENFRTGEVSPAEGNASISTRHGGLESLHDEAPLSNERHDHSASAEALQHIGQLFEPISQYPQQLDGLPEVSDQTHEVPEIVISEGSSQEKSQNSYPAGVSAHRRTPSAPGISFVKQPDLRSRSRSVHSEGDAFPIRRHEQRAGTIPADVTGINPQHLHLAPPSVIIQALGVNFDKIDLMLSRSQHQILLSWREPIDHIQSYQLNDALMMMEGLYSGVLPSRLSEWVAIARLMMAFACILHETKSYDWHGLFEDLSRCRGLINDLVDGHLFLSALDAFMKIDYISSKLSDAESSQQSPTADTSLDIDLSDSYSTILMRRCSQFLDSMSHLSIARAPSNRMSRILFCAHTASTAVPLSIFLGASKKARQCPVDTRYLHCALVRRKVSEGA